MLQILTKSPLILTHLDVLKTMRVQVQVEISFATHDESIRKKIEFFTPSIQKRLDLVESLSKEGLFVRIMAMPFLGDSSDLLKLKDLTFSRGAKAFKNKGLNYYKNWADLAAPMTYDNFLKAKIPTGKGRPDEKDAAMIIKGGEFVFKNGKPVVKSVLMPKMDDNFEATVSWGAMSKMAERFEVRQMQVIDEGYRDCNSVDWGYII